MLVLIHITEFIEEIVREKRKYSYLQQFQTRGGLRCCHRSLNDDRSATTRRVIRFFFFSETNSKYMIYNMAKYGQT